MSAIDFNLPDVGEGLTEAEIVQWRVAPGDRVDLNQVLVEVETAKSLVELPSPFEGVIAELCAAEGDTVETGAVILRIAAGVDADAAGGAPAPETTPAADEAAAEFDATRADVATTVSSEPREPAHRGAHAAPVVGTSPVAGASHGGAHAVGAPVASTAPAAAAASTGAESGDSSSAFLVGYGTGGAAKSRRAGRRGLVEAIGQEPGAPGDPNADAIAASAQAAAGVGAAASRLQRPVSTVPASSAHPIVAKPPIRKLARDLGVDLATVEPTGLAGETTRDDVLRHAHQASVFKNIETPGWGEAREEKHPVKGVRKAIAKAMVQSMFTAPHVTLFTDVDATRTMEFVKRLKASPDFAGVKVSPLLIVAKAVMWAIRRNPTVNAAWTDEEYTIKHYVNLGLAAATPRGLIVPNIKDAHGMTLLELAKAIEQLTYRARDGKTTPAEQKDGTFTITNIGVFGMDTGTPVLNPGEVGILAFGTIKPKPWVFQDEVAVRQVTTLGASFDHRLVDGDVASRFLADVAAIVEEPALLLD